MTAARLTTAREVEFEIIQFTDGAEFVLRDAHGDVRLFEESERERVEVRCDLCGRWSTDATPDTGEPGGPWTCSAGCDAS